jgi:hypothetical protein
VSENIHNAFSLWYIVKDYDVRNVICIKIDLENMPYDIILRIQQYNNNRTMIDTDEKFRESC